MDCVIFYWGPSFFINSTPKVRHKTFGVLFIMAESLLHRAACVPSFFSAGAYLCQLLYAFNAVAFLLYL